MTVECRAGGGGGGDVSKRRAACMKEARARATRRASCSPPLPSASPLVFTLHSHVHLLDDVDGCWRLVAFKNAALFTDKRHTMQVAHSRAPPPLSTPRSKVASLPVSSYEAPRPEPGRIEDFKPEIDRVENCKPKISIARSCRRVQTTKEPPFFSCYTKFKVCSIKIASYNANLRCVFLLQFEILHTRAYLRFKTTANVCLRFMRARRSPTHTKPPAAATCEPPFSVFHAYALFVASANERPAQFALSFFAYAFQQRRRMRAPRQLGRRLARRQPRRRVISRLEATFWRRSSM